MSLLHSIRSVSNVKHVAIFFDLSLKVGSQYTQGRSGALCWDTLRCSQYSDTLRLVATNFINSAHVLEFERTLGSGIVVKVTSV